MAIISNIERMKTAFVVFIVSSIVFSGAVLASKADYARAYSIYEKKELEFAEIIWTNLALKEDPDSQFALGLMHLRKEAKNWSLDQAYYWFKLAGKQNHSGALYNLGVAYLNGAGVVMDTVKAKQYLLTAAQLGHTNAQFNLALVQLTSGNEKGSRTQAMRWLSLAASKGHAPAQKQLDLFSQKFNLQDGLGAQNMSEGTDPSSAPAMSNEYGKVSIAPIRTELIYATNRAIPLFNMPNGTSLGSMAVNQSFSIVEMREDWVSVTMVNGMDVWVYGKYLDDNVDEGFVSINTDGVRARPLPSINSLKSPPIGSFNRGKKMRIKERDADWVKVHTDSKFIVWLKKSDFAFINPI